MRGRKRNLIWWGNFLKNSIHLQLLENKLEGMDLSLTFSVDKENFGAYEEVEVRSHYNHLPPSLLANCWS
jgi:hypothetical protein